MSRTDSPLPPEANPALRRPSDPGPDGPVGFVLASLRMAWRWLRRMRTALYLLGALGLLTLLATVVPQFPNVPRTVAQWRSGEAGPGRFVSAIIDLLGGYDVYGSPAFLALLLLLFTSLTACLIPRYRAWWRVLRRTRPPRSRHLEAQEQVAVLDTAADPADVHAAARRVLAGRRWRLRAPDADPDLPDQVAAEKGHVVREGGSLVFHTSFYVLLIGIVLGQLLGYSGQVGVVEGKAFTDTASGYWTSTPGRWWTDADHRAFTLTLDEFHVDWYRDVRLGGQPRVFLSDVTVRTEDGEEIERTVGGNDPMVVEGMKIHQLDWGYAPRVVVHADGEVLYDGYLTMSAAEGGFYSGAVKVPGADPDVGFEVFFWPYAPEDDDGTPQLTGAPWADAPYMVLQEFRGDLRLDAAQNVNTLDKTGLAEGDVLALRPGSLAVLPDGVTVAFPELRRWVGFQVSSRPTAPLLLTGAFLILAGLIPALYASRRRLWVGAAVDPASGRTRVTVAGRAFQRPQAFEAEHRRIVASLAAALAELPPSSPPPADLRPGDAPTEVVPR
ncbi:MAG: cytochrome c biogenesis protein ResB [Actinobacteria bacterium]|nr:cytochrome c biogenesis protein ResB [Actinomycetota bacterium]